VRNKILIVDANMQDREQLEQILQEIVEEGGELFFVDKREDGLAILKKEHPQLVFLENSFLGDDEKAWIQEGVHLVFMHEIKPFETTKVLEKCRSVLHKMPAVQIPPM
jgi:DNA-binding NtrC family response regulator